MCSRCSAGAAWQSRCATKQNSPSPKDLPVKPAPPGSGCPRRRDPARFPPVAKAAPALARTLTAAWLGAPLQGHAVQVAPPGTHPPRSGEEQSCLRSGISGSACRTLWHERARMQQPSPQHAIKKTFFFSFFQVCTFFFQGWGAWCSSEKLELPSTHPRQCEQDWSFLTRLWTSCLPQHPSVLWVVLWAVLLWAVSLRIPPSRPGVRAVGFNRNIGTPGRDT